jgi:chemotaxis signal transduction protein
MADNDTGDLKQTMEALKLGLVSLSDAKGTAAGPELPSVIVFNVANLTFGVDVNATEGVVDCPRVVPLPNPPQGVIGVTSVRGRITIVFDLALGSSGEKRRLILLRGEAQLGLLADRIESVVGLEPHALPGSLESGKRAEARRTGEESRWPATVHIGLNGKTVPIIDVERLSTF